MKRPVAILTITAAASIAAATGARAAPAGAQAEALFRQGKELLAAGKTAEACAAFEESQKLDPTVSTLLNHASCREKNNQLATAWGLFLEAERQTRAATDAATKKLHKIAADHASRVEPRVSKLTINVPGENRVDRLEIVRGAEVVTEAQWNRALPIDGGSYRITARAPSMSEWSADVTVGAESDAKTVDIPKLQAAAVAAATPASTTTTTTTAATTTPGAASTVSPNQPAAMLSSAPSAERSKVVPLVLAGGALVALGGALAFDLWGDSTYDRAKKEANPTTQDDLWHSANSKRYTAEGLTVVGLGCAGVAAWLIFFRGSGPETTTKAASAMRHFVIEPYAGSDRGGLGVAGTF